MPTTRWTETTATRADAPLWDIAPITHYPFNGSAITIFDSGPDGASPYGTDPAATL